MYKNVLSKLGSERISNVRSEPCFVRPSFVTLDCQGFCQIYFPA